MTKKNRFRFIILIFILSTVYLFMFSKSGLIERISLEKKNSLIDEKLKYYQHKKEKQKSLYSRYRKGEITDQDFLESGFIRKSDRILFLDLKSKEDLSTVNIFKREKVDIVNVNHLRILWIILSLVLLFYFYFKYSTKQKEFKN